MRLFVDTESGEAIGIEQIRARNPYSSIPERVGAKWLVANGFALLRIGERPDTTDSEVAELGDPTQDENGQWVREWTVRPKTQAELDETLAAERTAMKCSRLQGRLVLGEATCTALDAIAVDDLTPWAMRQTIQNAIEWSRMSQSMTELGYLLGYTDTQMDELFRQAVAVDV